MPKPTTLEPTCDAACLPGFVDCGGTSLEQAGCETHIPPSFHAIGVTCTNFALD